MRRCSRCHQEKKWIERFDDKDLKVDEKRKESRLTLRKRLQECYPERNLFPYLDIESVHLIGVVKLLERTYDHPEPITEGDRALEFIKCIIKKYPKVTFISFQDDDEQAQAIEDYLVRSACRGSDKQKCELNRLPQSDFSPPTPADLVATWRIIDDIKKNGTKEKPTAVVLHCNASTGRTPTMVLSYVWLQKYIEYPEYIFPNTQIPKYINTQSHMVTKFIREVLSMYDSEAHEEVYEGPPPLLKMRIETINSTIKLYEPSKRKVKREKKEVLMSRCFYVNSSGLIVGLRNPEREGEQFFAYTIGLSTDTDIKNIFPYIHTDHPSDFKNDQTNNNKKLPFLPRWHPNSVLLMHKLSDNDNETSFLVVYKNHNDNVCIRFVKGNNDQTAISEIAEIQSEPHSVFAHMKIKDQQYLVAAEHLSDGKHELTIASFPSSLPKGPIVMIPIPAGQKKKDASASVGNDLTAQKLSGKFISISPSPDGNFIALVTEEQISICNITISDSNEIRYSVSLVVDVGGTTHTSWSPNSKILFGGGRSLTLINTETLEVNIQSIFRLRKYHRGDINCSVWESDELLWTGGDDGLITAWKVDVTPNDLKMEIVREDCLVGHETEVFKLFLLKTNDKIHLMSIDINRRAIEWEIR